MEGLDLSFSQSRFKAKGRSDAKVKMMKELVGIGIGFEEMEKLNEEFNLRIRSETLKKQMKDGLYNQKKLVESVMGTVLLDETLVNKELGQLVEKERKNIQEETGSNTRKTRVRLKEMNKLANDENLERTEIYKRKIENLKRKYKEDKETKLDKVPPEIKEYKEAKIFSRKAFDEIEEVKVEVITVGEIEITPEEREILQMHPKHAILEKLDLRWILS